MRLSLKCAAPRCGVRSIVRHRTCRVVPEGHAVGCHVRKACAREQEPQPIVMSLCPVYAFARQALKGQLYDGGVRGEAGHGRDHQVTRRLPNTFSTDRLPAAIMARSPTIVQSVVEKLSKSCSGSPDSAKHRQTSADLGQVGQTLADFGQRISILGQNRLLPNSANI